MPTDIIDWFSKNSRQKVTSKAVTSFLREQEGTRYLDQKIPLHDGRRPRLWLIRNAERWLRLGIEILGKAWRHPEEPPLTEEQRKRFWEGDKS